MQKKSSEEKDEKIKVKKIKDNNDRKIKRKWNQFTRKT